MDLLLVRHALPLRVEGADGPADPALSELGHAQSRALAGWLAAETVHAVYTSPLARARETAAPLGASLGLEVVVEDGVAEFDKDADSYVPLEELKAAGDPRYEELLSGGYFDGGTMTAEEFRATVVEALDGIVDRHRGEVVAVVCHGGVINAALGHVLGIDDVMFFEPTYTGITRIRASSRGHRSMVSVNETAHLRDVR